MFGTTATRPITETAQGQKANEGKAIPLQSWTGPEGSRRLRLPDFKIIGT
jgi:hypothetical protein